MTVLTAIQDNAYFEQCEKYNLDALMDFDEQIQYLKDIDQKTIAIKVKKSVLTADASVMETAKPVAKKATKPSMIETAKKSLIAMLPIVHKVVETTPFSYASCREAESMKFAKSTKSGLQLGMAF